MTPQRIQLRRTKGWRKPEGAIVVARPSRWGNPYVVTTADAGRSARYGLGKDVVVRHYRRGHWDGTQYAGFIDHSQAVAWAVELFRATLAGIRVDVDGPHHLHHYLKDLAGHDLACWCPLDQPCHADVLLELANP